MIQDCGNFKLGGFESTYLLCKEEETISEIPNPIIQRYMSPELLKEKLVSRMADIWGLGLIIYEMCTVTNPFYAHGKVKTYVDYDLPGNPIHSQYSPKLRNMVERMLNKNHKVRPSAAELLTHNWLDQVGNPELTQADWAAQEFKVVNLEKGEK